MQETSGKQLGRALPRKLFIYGGQGSLRGEVMQGKSETKVNENTVQVWNRLEEQQKGIRVYIVQIHVYTIMVGRVNISSHLESSLGARRFSCFSSNQNHEMISDERDRCLRVVKVVLMTKRELLYLISLHFLAGFLALTSALPPSRTYLHATLASLNRFRSCCATAQTWNVILLVL